MFCKKEQKKEEPIIGEALIRVPNSVFYSLEAPHGNYVPKLNSSLQWIKFRQSDYNSGHDEFVCIFGVYIKREDVLFYAEEAFKDFKKTVENKYNPCISETIEKLSESTNRMSIDILKMNLARAFDRIVDLEKKVAELEERQKCTIKVTKPVKK